MKICIIGASGRLGKPLTEEFKKDSKYEVLSPPHSELDVTNQFQVFEYIQKTKPDIVVNLSALVSPPVCEENKQLAFKTTVLGTGILVDALQNIDPTCYFVLMSTPCVMQGENDNIEYYDESSLPYPTNYYGISKLLQEFIVIRNKLKFLIVRGNFVPREPWPYPESFSDRFGTYLFAKDLAVAMKEAVDSKVEGLIHLVGDKKMSMYELSQLCPDSKNVKKITLEEYYAKNPNSCHLTKNMSLKSLNWKSYKIGFSYNKGEQK